MSTFIHKNKVHMYDTDAAGILYFGNQFRFCHDAFEALMEQEDVFFKDMFSTYKYIFVIVHAESDYLAALHLGDHLDIHTSISRLGESSITISYEIFRDAVLVGKANTVHVCLDKINRKPMPIPAELKEKFSDYLPK